MGNEKNDMTQEIMEAERQVMLWDRKITLEKEMQDALDPNQGQADVTAMEKEIHRMELRFDQLKRRQEQMIMEMERAILKRDSIAQKYEPKAKKSKKDATTVNVKRQLQGLKNNLRLCTQANADAEQKISDREAGLADLRSTCDQAMEECAGLEHEVERVRNELQIKNIRKQRNLYSILKLQRTAKRLEDFARGTGSPVANNARAQYLEQVMLKKRIVDVVGDLRESYSHPQLDPLLRSSPFGWRCAQLQKRRCWRSTRSAVFVTRMSLKWTVMWSRCEDVAKPVTLLFSCRCFPSLVLALLTV